MLDVNTRAEWFDDADGSRTGKKAKYGEMTAGLNVMPKRTFNLRPEVRYDLASNAVFGPGRCIEAAESSMDFRLRRVAEVLTAKPR
jgi:hypothetical protein